MRISDGTKKKLISNLLFICSIVLLLLNIFLVFIVGDLHQSNKNTYVSDFTYDLSGVDFDNKKNTYLNGEWEFYYNTLIITDKIENPKMTASLSVPSSWADCTKYETPFPNGGYASYRCYIENVSAHENLRLYIPNIACAYNIFINGNLVTISGELSKNPDSIYTSPSNVTVPFTLESNKQYEVVIEVSSNNFSGLYLSPLIANYEYDSTYVQTMTSIRFCFMGIVFFCCFFSFILRLFINKNLYSNWLPVLLFALFIRMSITTEVYAITQPTFSYISYEDMNLFIFAFTFIIKLLACLYLFRCINTKISNSTIVLFFTLALVLSSVTELFPQNIFEPYFFTLIQILSGVIDLYIINKLCIEIVNKTKYALFYLFSYMFIVSGITIDALYTNGILSYRLSSYMSFMIFAFVVLTVIIHALRIRKIYYDALRTQQLQSELENMNMSIMLSQIQPHFLYNALNTIKSLIKKNPQQAENAIIDFSLYLRGNMDSLSKDEPILFSEEVQHVKYYCNIEKLRFGDKLDIYYDIKIDSFYVPTLSVQPIVENAIKHGVTKKPEGGSIAISTYDDLVNYYIKIEDDGVGFDPEIVNKKDDNRSHVGLKNTIVRIKEIMDGKVNVNSIIDEGTTITVVLPKISNKKNNVEDPNKIKVYRGIKK